MASTWRDWGSAAQSFRALLGRRHRGFYLPHRHADRAAPIGYPAVEARFAARQTNFAERLSAAEAFSDRLLSFKGPPPTPRWDQDWFPRLDGAMAYTIVREFRPRRIVEIGCGHSTRFLAQAVRDAGISTEICCIDPAPRAALAGLGVRHLQGILQDVAELDLPTLAATDLLFIDSSHVAMPGTDVDLLFNRILPALPSGVLVHVHDTFLPDPYPADWAWRGYNEQLLTAALLASGALIPLFASHYVATRMDRRLAGSPLAGLPLLSGAYELSLWAEVP